MVAQVWRVSEPERRLDLFVVKVCEGLSRSAAQRLIAEGRVRVNGAPAEAGWRLRPGDEVTILLPPREEEHPQAEAIPLSILYEDEHLLVVNKPAGMATHPGAGRSTGTLVNALLAYRPEIASVGEDPLRPGIVHRLDRETSGVLVV
ncbi:MAG: RluA family pseudouridine synthase, partial [Chloroflexi bacterium]|nr:RluA family pseudouridine synthase [Chloroflexota bacterium]